MSDMFEKLGNLLSEKIQEETKNGGQPDSENIESVLPPKENVLQDQPALSKEDLQILKQRLSQNKKSPVTGEVIRAGAYTEDVPVKIIDAEVTFPEKQDK